MKNPNDYETIKKIKRGKAEAIRIYGLDKWKAKGNGLFLYQVGSSCISG